MDIYDFFNSKDVAAHCKSIGHTFNAAESAVMISQSVSRTLVEKHVAYREIVAECPDIEIPEGLNHGHIESFHAVLKEIIAYEERERDAFLLREPGAVYQATFCYSDDRRSYEGGIFTSYEKALLDALARLNAEEEPEADGFRHMDIRKIYADSEAYMRARVSRSGEILEIDQGDASPQLEQFEYAYLLQALYIDVPVPFARGDLVEIPDSGNWMGNVFVLKDTCRDDKEWNAKRILVGDTDDMTANVFYESAGTVQCECIHFYPDLQYRRRAPEGEARILKYVSLYMQDKLCLCSLLKIQKYLLLDEKTDELRADYALRYELSRIDDDLLESHSVPKGED